MPFEIFFAAAALMYVLGADKAVWRATCSRTKDEEETDARRMSTCTVHTCSPEQKPSDFPHKLVYFCLAWDPPIGLHSATPSDML